MESMTKAVIWYVAFVFSTTLHEAAHAFAALKGGDPTAYEGGQVTIDPTPHIRRSPFGMVVVPILSLIVMGWPRGVCSRRSSGRRSSCPSICCIPDRRIVERVSSGAPDP